MSLETLMAGMAAVLAALATMAVWVPRRTDRDEAAGAGADAARPAAPGDQPDRDGGGRR